jgi:hypothetical protein
MFHGLGSKKEKYYFSKLCIKKEAKVPVHVRFKTLYCPESGEVTHIKHYRCLSDISHTVTNPTNSVLSARCAVQSFNDTSTLTQILLSTSEQPHFAYTLTQIYLTPTHAHYSKEHKHYFTSLNYVPQVSLLFHNVACLQCC